MLQRAWILILLTFPAAADETYVLLTEFGETGTAPGELNYPFDVTVVGERLYVGDSNNDRVEIYDLEFNRVGGFGGTGAIDGKFSRNRGIGRTHPSVTPVQLFVTDAKNDRVQRFDIDGNHEATWGSIGDGTLEFFRPRGVEGAPDGSIVICDTDNHRMKVYNSDLSIRVIFGSRGSGNRRFVAPFDVVVDDDGLFYVSDLYNSKVKVYNLDGQFIRKWGSYGTGDGEFVAPEGIAIGPDGNIFVADRSDETLTVGRVQIFSPEGEFLGSFGSFGAGPGQFNRVTGLCFDGLGRIYAADADLDKVSVWVKATVENRNESIGGLKSLFDPR